MFLSTSPGGNVRWTLGSSASLTDHSTGQIRCWHIGIASFAVAEIKSMGILQIVFREIPFFRRDKDRFERAKSQRPATPQFPGPHRCQLSQCTQIWHGNRRICGPFWNLLTSQVREVNGWVSDPDYVSTACNCTQWYMFLLHPKWNSSPSTDACHFLRRCWAYWKHQKQHTYKWKTCLSLSILSYCPPCSHTYMLTAQRESMQDIFS
jgi:hypothetical protein